MNLRIPRVSTLTLKLSFMHRLDLRNRLEFDDDLVDKKIQAIGTVDFRALVGHRERQLPDKWDLP